MSWHFIERWLQKVNQHSTLVGKFWITFLIVFRIVVVSSIGDRVYSDEQSEFKCNSAQPGCANVCFNQFSPISHIRFWSFQIIMVCTPSIMFMVYSAHQTRKKGGKEKGSSNNSPTSPDKSRKPDLIAAQWKTCPSDEDNSKKKSKRKKSQFENVATQQDPPKKSKKKDSIDDSKLGFKEHFALYLLSVVVRTIFEVLFILLQYQLFGLHIRTLYKCEEFPCPNVVDCFVSRPMEKTIFLWFMLIIALISFTLNIMEIYYLFVKIIMCGSKKRRSDRGMKLFTKELRDITIHDAEIVDGGIIAPRNAPPDYGRIDNGGFDGDQFADGIDYLKNPPMAISVSLDDALIAEHMTGRPAAKLMGPSAPPRARDLLLSNPSLDQSYANLKRPDQRNGKNPKKGNDYYDYV